MKKISYFFLSIFILSALHSQGQAIAISSYVEQTKTSPKIGTNVGLKWSGIYPSLYRPYAFEVGTFYQREAKGIQIEGVTIQREKTFGGFYFESTLVHGRIFTLDLNIRTGVQNGENFVITPALKTRFHMSKQLSFGIGLGARTCQPTGMLDFKITL